MSGDERDVEMALDMLKQDYLLSLAEERGIKHKLDRNPTNAELRERLLEEDWPEPEFKRLLDAVENCKKETDLLGYYVGIIEDVAQVSEGDSLESQKETIKNLLSETKSRFDEEDNLQQEGFEILEDKGTDPSGIYWTKTTSYRLNPKRKLYTQESLYSTNFRIDLNNGIIYVGASRPPKANQLVKVLGEHGISTREIGSHPLFIHPGKSNEIFKSFVEELKETTREEISQQTMNSFMGEGKPDRKINPTLEIFTVEVITEDEALEEAELSGKSDIFEDQALKNLLNNRGGRIASVNGRFIFEGVSFGFRAGYGNENALGRISVQKRGSASIEPTLVDECFAHLRNLYIKHFVKLEFHGA